MNMTTLTLLVKASNAGQLKQIDDLLKAEFENLDVEVKILGNPVNKWVQVSLSGEDEGIATSYTNKEIGTCPMSLENVKNFPFLKGYISKVDENKQELKVDVGVFEPKVIHATMPLAYLQAQLADGRAVALKKISEIYGFHEGLPLNVKVIRLNSEENEVLHAELSVEQIQKYHAWQQSLLDRLIILGASKDTIETVLERTRLNRDVIGVESLGLFEHALTCKLGTDAAGLIPKIGRYMRNSMFIVFNAKKSLNFLSEQASTL
jgi:hypothetical protein